MSIFLKILKILVLSRTKHLYKMKQMAKVFYETLMFFKMDLISAKIPLMKKRWDKSKHLKLGFITLFYFFCIVQNLYIKKNVCSGFHVCYVHGIDYSENNQCWPMKFLNG